MLRRVAVSQVLTNVPEQITASITTAMMDAVSSSERSVITWQLYDAMSQRRATFILVAVRT
jgi:hypothetical protein